MTDLAAVLGPEVAAADPGALSQRAGLLRETAEHAAEITTRLGAAEAGGWRGAAATKFAGLKGEHLVPDLRSASNAFGAASDGLSAHARAVNDAHNRGNDLVRQITDVENEMESRKAQFGAAQSTLRSAQSRQHRATFSTDQNERHAAGQAVDAARRTTTRLALDQADAQARLNRLWKQAEGLRHDFVVASRHTGQRLEDAAQVAVRQFDKKPAWRKVFNVVTSVAGGIVTWWDRHEKDVLARFADVAKRFGDDVKLAAKGQWKKTLLFRELNRAVLKPVDRARRAITSFAKGAASALRHPGKFFSRAMPWMGRGLKGLGKLRFLKPLVRKLPVLGAGLTVLESLPATYRDFRAGDFRSGISRVGGTAGKVLVNVSGVGTVIDLVTGGSVSSAIDATSDVAGGRSSMSEMMDGAANGKYGPLWSIASNNITAATAGVMAQVAYATGDPYAASYQAQANAADDRAYHAILNAPVGIAKADLGL